MDERRWTEKRWMRKKGCEDVDERRWMKKSKCRRG